MRRTITSADFLAQEDQALPARTDLDPWVLFFATVLLFVAIWLSRSVRSAHQARPPADLWSLLAIAGLAAGLCSIGYGINALLLPFGIFVVLSVGLMLAARHLSFPGAAWLSGTFLGLVTGWLWGCLFINELSLSYWVEAVALIGLTLTLLVSFLSLIERIAREAVLTHGSWREPFRAPQSGSRYYRPKVSLHLPCYAEPPEVVKETMNRLAALDYDNFEVLVCDNNTKDEALWRPLEEHAEVLNRQAGKELFRFFHKSPLPGAKAGALNFLLGEMAADTEIVAVVDADYYSKPDFLARLVPFFENPEIGYLQTPHDYRDFENSAYLSACYAEYMPNNKVDMLGVHEYGGAFTIGTMCLLRARALKAVGGWAEWCLTEDSEVSVRMRAAGLRGIYLNETFGRGLIPATFDDYKKQRFRWTAGPVQQLRRYWRLFLPWPHARRMPGWTKLLEVLRCIAPLQTLLGVVTSVFLLGGIAVTSALGRIRPVDIPDIAWALLPLAAITAMVRIWHRYRLSGIMRVGDMVRGEIARAALSYVVLLAGVAGLSKKPLAWRRTPKFDGGDTVAGALHSALPETLLGLGCLALAGYLASLAPGLGWEMALLGTLGMVFLAIRFLCAPYLALLALRTIKPARQDEQATSTPLPPHTGAAGSRAAQT